MSEGLEKDIDFRDMLMGLTIDQLLLAANFLMNRSSVRTIGELGHHLGGKFELHLERKESSDE